MDRVALLRDARAARLEIAVDGDRLIVRGPAWAEAVARSLIEHKAEIIALISADGVTDRETDNTTDWRDLYEQRAAHWSLEGRRSRAEAEALAWGELENRWHRMRGERVPPDICAGCRRPIAAAEALVLSEFLPWHRELCNRFEALLRKVDPQLSLHYWDWTTDPRGLFTAQFMGS